jgi:hypothetical protein
VSGAKASAGGAGGVAHLTLNGRIFDRRTFLGAAGLAAGAALVGPLLSRRLAGDAAQKGDLRSSVPALDGGWHVDDMWGHWPPYAHPIPYAPVQAASVSWDYIDPVDHMFLT